MATSSWALNKTGRKKSPTQTIQLTSPSQQKKAEETEKGKADTIIGMQNIQAALLMIQEGMKRMEEKMSQNHEETRKNQEVMQKNMEEIKDELKNMDEKIIKIQSAVISNEQKIQKLEEGSEFISKKQEVMENVQSTRNKDFDEALAHLEMEKASFFLRFQNIEEEKEEDLGEVMIDLIATSTKKEKNEVRSSIDEVYRSYTNYARRNKLPKEVHVRFTKKSIKEEIYWKMREEPVRFKGREVIILKQTPKRVRDKRLDYNFLTKKLNRHRVKFRWLIPEGILISWEDKKIRVDDIDKAQDFIDRYLNDEDEQTGRESKEGKDLNERKKRPANSKDGEQEKRKQGREGTVEISQRETRSKTKQADK